MIKPCSCASIVCSLANKINVSLQYLIVTKLKTVIHHLQSCSEVDERRSEHILRQRESSSGGSIFLSFCPPGAASNHTMLLKLSLPVSPSNCCQAEKKTEPSQHSTGWWWCRWREKLQDICMLELISIAYIKTQALTGNSAAVKMLFIYLF